ncbi:hypothetical protein QBC44DRAFT_50902 [Cladorrhinum sp. PSN332]|nr:hypothetical protein QBC44DRAFT_50902 [Cladorrhinum sp. PSN332]
MVPKTGAAEIEAPLNNDEQRPQFDIPALLHRWAPPSGRWRRTFHTHTILLLVVVFTSLRLFFSPPVHASSRTWSFERVTHLSPGSCWDTEASGECRSIGFRGWLLSPILRPTVRGIYYRFTHPKSGGKVDRGLSSANSSLSTRHNRAVHRKFEVRNLSKVPSRLTWIHSSRRGSRVTTKSLFILQVFTLLQDKLSARHGSLSRVLKVDSTPQSLSPF